MTKYSIEGTLNNGIKIKVKIHKKRFHKLLWDLHLLEHVNDIENIEIKKLFSDEIKNREEIKVCNGNH